jgi:heat shock gene repressor HrcA
MIAIVEGYTSSNYAEPIGSSALAKHEDLNVSTATLRNEMALLEELGYLEKTHTSSGRIPTEKGYRLYVDELMNIDELEEELTDQVEQYFENSKLSTKDALEALIKSIVDNKEFNYGSVMLEKTAYNSSIKKISFVSLKSHRGIFIMVTDQGLVLHRETNIPEGLNVSSIENTVEYLDEKLHDVLLNDFKNAKGLEFINDDFFDYISNGYAVLELCLRNIRKLVDSAISVFIMPPSLEVLKNRLSGRKTDSDEVINKRMISALSEISCAEEYDYIVVNDNGCKYRYALCKLDYIKLG